MKRFVSMIAATALVLMVQFASCLPTAGANEQSMKCCASMPCTPANHSHGCCKNMASGKALSILPAQQVSLHAPSAVILEYPRTPEFLHRTSEFPQATEAQQHSPPELYTLYASLLI